MRSVKVLIRLKIAVFAPMPSAKVATATTVKLEDLRSLRYPRAKSFSRPIISQSSVEHDKAILRPRLRDT